MSDQNGGNLGSAILNLYWLGLLLVVLILLLIRRLPMDEATMIERARVAGGPI